MSQYDAIVSHAHKACESVWQQAQPIDACRWRTSSSKFQWPGCSGSGLDLQFGSTQSAEPEPQMVFGSPATPNLDLHMGSGSGPNQVQKVQTSDHGQYTDDAISSRKMPKFMPKEGTNWGVEMTAWTQNRKVIHGLDRKPIVEKEDHQHTYYILVR